MLYYYYGNGKKQPGKIRICQDCKIEELIPIYRTNIYCKACGSKRRKDAIKDTEISLPQKKSKYKMRAKEISCDKCKQITIVVNATQRKTSLCKKCANIENGRIQGIGKFGVLNRGYKNGIGTYIKRGRKKNNGKCSSCQISENIHIHHIDQNRKNNEISNLIPLCGSCHMYIHVYLRKGLSHDEAFNAVKKKKSVI